MRANTFPRGRRLQKRSDFLECYAKGRKHVTAHFVIYACKGSDPARFGLTVSRKVGNAVKRSRVKRLLRETLRLFDGDLTGISCLAVIARHNAAALGLAMVKTEIYPVLRKLGQSA